jgi:DNA-binding transcriptional ArsR family regulator
LFLILINFINLALFLYNMVNFIVKEEEGIKKYDSCIIIGKENFKAINNLMKIKILELLSEKPLFINQIASRLKTNEQNIYYHMKRMGAVLDVVEEKKIRGVIAKKYYPRSTNVCLSLSKNFKEYPCIAEKPKELNGFFYPFIKSGKMNFRIVVGSPDPHGPFKARSRDGHYAITLALYLGALCNPSGDLAAVLDVDFRLAETAENTIIVGGPVANLAMAEANKDMTVCFKEGEHWGIKGRRGIYIDDNCGIIARFPNPFNDQLWVLVIAGIRFSGTKAAVLALTKYANLLLTRFTGQKEFYAVVQGFDMDGDGKLDSCEIIE